MSAQSIPEYVRRLDVEAFAALGPHDRYRQMMLADSPGRDEFTEVNYIQTAPGLGSPRGMHTHPYDQIYFMVKGTLDVDIEGSGPDQISTGDIVIFPAGVPHRNWNASDESTIHIAINLVKRAEDAHLPEQ